MNIPPRAPRFLAVFPAILTFAIFASSLCAAEKNIFDEIAQKNATGMKKIVFIADSGSHGARGNHEFLAGSIYMARVINAAYPNAYAVVHSKEKIPKDLSYADEIVIILNHGGTAAANAAVKAAADKGAGVAAIHFGVEVNKGEQGDNYLRWLGGYFETKWSVNPNWKPDFKEIPVHEITRGVKPFSVTDEWYYHMRFVPDEKGIIPLLSDLPPLRTIGDKGQKTTDRGGNPDVWADVSAGKKQIMSWAFERPDGGRGFGFTGYHHYNNLTDDSFRTLLLNAVAWTAKLPIPEKGIETKTPTAAELDALVDEGHAALKEKGI